MYMCGVCSPPGLEALTQTTQHTRNAAERAQTSTITSQATARRPAGARLRGTAAAGQRRPAAPSQSSRSPLTPRGQAGRERPRRASARPWRPAQGAALQSRSGALRGPALGSQRRLPSRAATRSLTLGHQWAASQSATGRSVAKPPPARPAENKARGEGGARWRWGEQTPCIMSCHPLRIRPSRAPRSRAPARRRQRPPG